MTYTNEKIITRYESGENLKFLFFWGHQRSDKVTKSCFSQWYEATFVINGITYFTAEHFMMAEKALLFNDHEIHKKITKCTHPAQAKKLGRQVKNFNQEIWEANRFDIVVKGNIQKFSQNPELTTFLINTQNRILVEASPVDSIWGIGLSQDNPKVHNPNLWEGLNLLGHVLMEVRDYLNQNPV